MNIHVISPFYRKHLVNTLINYLEPMKIEWYPVCDQVDIEPFKTITIPWIHPLLCEPLKLPGDQSFKKINHFLDTMKVIDDDYYCFMGDDDMYEPNFFNVIRQQTAKIIFFSGSRGNRKPINSPAIQGFRALRIFSKDDIKLGNINVAQYVIKGEIFKQIRFKNDHPHDDGTFAIELKERFQHDFIILPDLFVFINYFEPGRYTNRKFKLKPNWELPKLYN